MIPIVTLRQALADPALLGYALPGTSWQAWRSIMFAAMGEQLEPDELETFRRYTGRSEPPSARIEEAAFIIGRRGGKDRAASVLASYIAGLCRHPQLAPGERGLVLIIAPDQKQSRIQKEYVAGVLEQSPVLSQLVESKSADSISLSNRIDIEVRSANFRRLRGPTCVAVIATEAAFWFSEESANPDTEILNAVRPTLATTGGPLITISSPYARRGELWSTYSKHFGSEGDPAILVVQGTSREFNPTLPQRVVDRALERDRAAASAEYLAQFRQDIEGFVSLEVVQACIEPGVRERAPRHGIEYRAFIDPSGGSSDPMTLAVAHRENERVVIDVTREVRPPFSPEAVVEDFSELLARYGVTRVKGDRFAGEWCREPFRKRGIGYEANAAPKSDLYRDFLPLLNAGTVVLLDDDRVVAQIVGLERRTARSGRDSIDHAPNGHDDLANAVAGVTGLVSADAACSDVMVGISSGDGSGPIVWKRDEGRSRIRVVRVPEPIVPWPVTRNNRSHFLKRANQQELP